MSSEDKLTVIGIWSPGLSPATHCLETSALARVLVSMVRHAFSFNIWHDEYVILHESSHCVVLFLSVRLVFCEWFYFIYKSLKPCLSLQPWVLSSWLLIMCCQWDWCCDLLVFLFLLSIHSLYFLWLCFFTECMHVLLCSAWCLL